MAREVARQNGFIALGANALRTGTVNRIPMFADVCQVGKRQVANAALETSRRRVRGTGSSAVCGTIGFHLGILIVGIVAHVILAVLFCRFFFCLNLDVVFVENAMLKFQVSFQLGVVRERASAKLALQRNDIVAKGSSKLGRFVVAIVA